MGGGGGGQYPKYGVLVILVEEFESGIPRSLASSHRPG